MGLVWWFAAGLVAGLTAELLMRHNGRNGAILTNLMLGTGGALLGGFIATWMGFGGIARWDWRGFTIAVLCAALLLLLSRTVQTAIGRTPQMVRGVLLVLAGAALALWAQGHSPNMDLGQALMKADSFILREPFYIAALLISLLLVLVGIASFVRALQSDQ